MNILVTGGAGFIGSHLVERLVDIGHNVTVLDDLSNGSLDNLKRVSKQIAFFKKDVSEPFWNAYPSDDEENIFDIIFHLACWPRSRSLSNPQRDVDVNIKGMVNILELAKKTDTTVIFSSNSGIYNTSKIPINEKTNDNPKTPYDLDKKTAEEYLKLYNKIYGLKFIIFRFATIYGPRQTISKEWKPVVAEFVDKLSNSEPPTIFWDGEQTRDFLYVDDLVDALILSINSHNSLYETIILGSGTETSINTLYMKISEILGSNLQPKQAPKTPGDIRRMKYDCTKAQNILKWKPKTSLEDGIKNLLKHGSTRKIERERRSLKTIIVLTIGLIIYTMFLYQIFLMERQPSTEKIIINISKSMIVAGYTRIYSTDGKFIVFAGKHSFEPNTTYSITYHPEDSSTGYRNNKWPYNVIVEKIKMVEGR